MIESYDQKMRLWSTLRAITVFDHKKDRIFLSVFSPHVATLPRFRHPSCRLRRHRLIFLGPESDRPLFNMATRLKYSSLKLVVLW